MTRLERRRFQAQVVIDHCGGNTSLAKTVFGWDQVTTRKALLEQETGTTISNQPRQSRRTFSEKLPNLQNDIRSLVDPNSQTHPTFQTSFRYTRMTAKAVLESLVKEKGYKLEELPALSTMRKLLGDMGYCLRRVQKTQKFCCGAQKKFPKQKRSSRTSKPPMQKATKTTKRYESR
jgi:Rhodopirellula transposase.